MTENAENIEARTNLIRMMKTITENPKARNVIKRKALKTQEIGLIRLIVEQF